jgi:hypothetical protein
VDLPGIQGHVGYFAAVFKALSAGSPMPVTLYDALHTLAITEAARQASDERRAVDVQALETRM